MSSPLHVWEFCSGQLQTELPAPQFNTWIRPLKLDDAVDVLRLLAPTDLYWIG